MKVFKNRRESPLDTTHNETVPQLIRVLVTLGTRGFFARATRSFRRVSAAGRRNERVTYKSWPKLETAHEKSLAPRVSACLLLVPNQRPAYLLLSVWLVQESFLRETFSVEMSPQSLLYQFHPILLYHWGEKFYTFINLKGQKHFFCTCLTSMPSKKKILLFFLFCILAWLPFVWCCWWFVVCV